MFRQSVVSWSPSCLAKRDAEVELYYWGGMTKSKKCQVREGRGRSSPTFRSYKGTQARMRWLLGVKTALEHFRTPSTRSWHNNEHLIKVASSPRRYYYFCFQEAFRHSDLPEYLSSRIRYASQFNRHLGGCLRHYNDHGSPC